MRRLCLLCILACALLLCGCVRCDLTLEIGRFGQASVTCRMEGSTMARLIVDPLCQDFKDDGYTVEEFKQKGHMGFVAKKDYRMIKEIGKAKVIRRFQGIKDDVNKVQQQRRKAEGKSEPPQQQPRKKAGPLAVITGGWLFDHVSVDTELDMSVYGDDAKASQLALTRMALQQVDLNFYLRLPTYTDTNNATRVSSDGRVLVWKLIPGENNHLTASATYLNPLKAAGYVVVLLIAAGAFYVRNRKAQKRGED